MKQPVTSQHGYSDEYFTSVTVKSKSAQQRYVSFLEDNGIQLKNKKILDIGCADGNFLAQLENMNDIYGCDISSSIIHKAKTLFSQSRESFATVDLNSSMPPFKTQFDIITMFDVIEHLTNFQPLADYIKLNLKSKGYFIITTPNAISFLRFLSRRSFTGEVDKTHTMLFTPYTLDFYLRRLGLTRVSLSTPYSFYFKDNLLTRSLLFGGQIFALYQKK